MSHDAIVIGAGPSGSTAARLLARRGASVLLLDRARFPRDKPCGGGVTIRAAAYLDLDLGPVSERTIYGARFSLRLGPTFDRWHRQPLTYMTQRCRLDAYLAEAACESGADFRDGMTVREVEVDNGQVTVRSNGDAYTARALVAADGANGIGRRGSGLRPQVEEAVALEGNIRFSPDIPSQWQELLALDLGALAGGYGWVFPKSDHLNLGVGAWKYAASTLRPKLAHLCRRYGFDGAELENLRGHHLPIRISGTPVARGPTLAVGDAAGLSDPLSGEGIHMAFLSARLAADAIIGYLAGETADLSPYQRAVERHLQTELTAARKLQELFHFAPPPYVAMLRHSRRFWQAFCCLIRGELTYRGFLARVGPLRPLLVHFAGVAQRRRVSKVARLTSTLD
ncbi:MAG: NAD(P)/FAD-dependent oxidoreductase [Dehalococcoidia bacterium]